MSPSVVVIRAKGGEVTAGGQARFLETGSGVLVSRDGKVMTAAHVVHAMDPARRGPVSTTDGKLRAASIAPRSSSRWM